MVAVFGTMVADGLHDGAGVPYAVTHGVVRGRRRRSSSSLAPQRGHAVHPQHHHPPARAVLLGAVLATFALGTAAGDLTAITLNLGFLASVVLFAAVIAVPALAWWRFGSNPVVAFWAAYVVTRPLGASVADWLGKPHDADRAGPRRRRRSAARARSCSSPWWPTPRSTKRDIQRPAAETWERDAPASGPEHGHQHEHERRHALQPQPAEG